MPNYESNGVLFKDITAGLNTGGQKINKAPYKYENGNIKNPQTIINAIDIDWNSAEVPGISDPITSTSQLLSIIGQLKQSLLDTYATTAYVDNKIEAAIENGEGFERIIEEIQDRIDSYHLEYQIITTLSNVTANSNNAITMKKNDVVTLQFSPNTGYLLPNEVTVQGATYEYTQGTGKIVISNPTDNQISIIITANDKRQCTFTPPTLNQLDFTIISGSKSYYVINDTFTGKLSLKSTADPELYGLPTSVNGTNCTISNYNATTGEFTIKCTGAGNMTISATVKDVANYRFAVALETNPIFTVSGGTITAMNVSYISTLEGAMSAIGRCPVNFDTGFMAPDSVDVENINVWFIIPSKYFNTSNFNFINGNNRYLLKQSNIQDLTVDTKIKECVSITTDKIPYTLVCVSNNGLGGKQDFKKL